MFILLFNDLQASVVKQNVQLDDMEMNAKKNADVITIRRVIHKQALAYVVADGLV